MPIRSVAALLPSLILLFALGCTEPQVGGPDASFPPDAGDSTVDAGPPPPPASLTLEWRAENHGETWAIEAVDLDGDGTDEIVHAGRGLAVFDVAGLATNTPRWSVNWSYDEAYSTTGGDNDWAFDVATVGDIDGDHVPDLVAATSFLELLAVSGADGHTLWHRPLEGNGGQPTQLAVIDADDDGVGDIFAAGSPVAYSGRTGETLWNTALSRTIVAVSAAQLDADPARELVVALERPGFIGGGPRPPGPMLFGFDDNGTELFRYTGASDRASALVVRDLDGDGLDESIVMAGSELSVVNADGGLRFKITRELPPQMPPAIEAAKVDGEVRIFLALLDMESGPRVEAWDATGTLVWEEALDFDTIGQPNAASFRAGPHPLLVVATGQTSPATGSLVALEVSDEAPKRIAWQQAIGYPGTALVSAKVGGAEALVAGGQSAALFGLSPTTGAFSFTGVTGSFVVQVLSGDLDGDGIDELVTLDDHGFVRAVGADGRQRWATQLAVNGAGVAERGALADLDGDGKAEVIAGGYTYSFVKDPGVLQVLDGRTGAARATLRTGAAPTDVAVADLDGDGTPEIVTALAPIGFSSPDPCKVMLLDRNLVARWSVPGGVCFFARIAVGDADGAPGLEILYGDTTLASPPHVALITKDGQTRWNIESNGSTSTLAIHKGGLFFGGGAEGERGRLARRSVEDGSIVQELQFDPREQPDSQLSGIVTSFAFVPDRTRDGTDEIVVGLQTGEAALIDGAAFTPTWKKLFEPADREAADRHTIGAVAYLPAHATHGDALVVGLGALQRMKSSVLAVDFEGTVLGTVATQGEARSVVVGRGAGAQPIVWLGAGLDVYALSGRAAAE